MKGNLLGVIVGGVGVIVVDILIGLSYRSAFEQFVAPEVAVPVNLGIVSVLYLFAGLTLSPSLYRRNKPIGMVMGAFGIALLIRLCMVLLEPLIFMPTEEEKAFMVLEHLATPAYSIDVRKLTFTVMATITEGLATVAAVFVGLRFLEQRKDSYRYATTSQAKKEGGKTTAVCSACHERIVVARERSQPFVGVAQEWFCNNCRIFIGGNPTGVLLVGIGESALALLMFIPTVMHFVQAVMEKSRTLEIGVWGIMLLYMVYDGIRKVSAGARAGAKAA